MEDQSKSNKYIALYVNGNNKCGLGHIYRVFQLAEELKEHSINVDIYFDINKTKREVFGNSDYNIIPVDGVEDLVLCLKEKEYIMLINDILSTSIVYMTYIRVSCPEMKIVNFEDDGEGATYADLVINALYNEVYKGNVKVGADYYIAHKSFLNCKPITIKDRVENILVTFGGADQMDYTSILMDIAQEEKYKDKKFIFVVGRANKEFRRLLKIKRENLEIMYNIDNMKEVMSKCDIAITSRGRTGYELAMLGIPTISIAQNEREEKHGFMSSSNGFDYIGYNPSKASIEKALDRLVSTDIIERKAIQEKMLANDLRSGRQRVINSILELW